MREVYLLRHGQAEPHAAGGDSARRLTDHGREQARAAGLGMVRVGVQVDAIWHSPFARAVETAAIVAEILGCGALLEQGDITPSGDPAVAALGLRADRTQRLLVVSHLPFIPGLAGALCRAPVRLDVGTADLISLGLLGDGPAYLRALIPNAWWGDAREQSSGQGR